MRIRGLAFADTPDFLEGQLRRWLRIEPNARHGETADGRPITFWLMWDAEHLYIAGRSPVGEHEPLHADVRGARDRPVLIHDDVYEFAIDASPAGAAEGAEPGVRRSTINAAGFTHHRRFAPDFQPNGVIHRLDLDLDAASEVWSDEDGRRWWDVQVAYDLDDLGVADALQAGDELRISLARVLQFPWRYASLPTGGKYMKSGGFPIATLVEGEAAEDVAGKVVHAIERVEGNEREPTPAFLPAPPNAGELPVSLTRFDPRSQTLHVEADLRHAALDPGEQATALRVSVLPAGRGEAVHAVTSRSSSHDRFSAAVPLDELPPGTHHLRVALLDGDEQPLLERTLPPFDKIDAEPRSRYVWRLPIDADAKRLAGQPALRDLPPVTDRVNEWVREGTAAGNVGDFYHNHDHLHSYLALQKFPQLTPIDATESRRSLISAGIQIGRLYTGRVIGNASMVAGVSYPEYAYQRPDFVEALYQQYTHNHLYCYVSYRTGPRDYSAYTPYVVATVGASGSEQKHLEAFFATLAAFRPEVKQRLTERGRIAPTLQLLLRRHYQGVDSEEDYLTAKAHPEVFHRKHVGLEAMVEAARAMTLDTLPPMVKLDVLEENFGRAEGTGRRFTTPGAIARFDRSHEGVRHLRITAANSTDPADKELRFRWVVLRGDADRIEIKPHGDDAVAVDIRIQPHEQRVDIAAFAHNGSRWSAPAIVSVDYREAAR